MSYYLKYRPQKISELDLTDVRDNLLSSLKKSDLSHAYLFVGPRGSGKTSAARILSQVINCEERKDGSLGEPCGKCKVCIGIKAGSMVDVLEMDAASHRGIDDIRSLKERIKLSPVSLKKKVYIIDEVHMLTREAFNALLKVLEEPPAHVMFFLCTTELHKVPETIISRCTKIAFTKATKKEVQQSLMKVVKGEKLKIDTEAIELLADSVDGSFREGHKLLEQLASKEGQINEVDVKKILGLAGKEDVVELINMSLEGRTNEIGKVLAEMELRGINAGNLLEDLLKCLREMIRVPHQSVQDGGVGKEIELAGLLIESAEMIKVSPLPFLPIELALLEIGLKSGGEPLTPIASDKLRDSSTSLGMTGDVRLGRNEKENILSLSKIEEDWGKLLDRISSKNRSVAGLLRASKPKLADGNNLTVEVFYEFHKTQLEQDSKRLLIEQAAEELWGPMVLRCVLGDKQQKPLAEVDDCIKAAEDVFGN